MSGTVRTLHFAPTWGPMAGFLRLMQDVTVAPAQGPWLPCAIFKQASVEIEGTFATATVGIQLSNALLPPLNGYKIAIGGTITPNDIVSVTVTSSVVGTVTVEHTVASGDTPNSIATTLAANLGANLALAAAGFFGSEGSGVITIQFPSLPPGESWGGAGISSGTPGTSPPVNYVTVSANVSGAATETATVGLVTNGESALTINAAPWRATVAATMPARWVQGYASQLSGAAAEINVNYVGVA